MIAVDVAAELVEFANTLETHVINGSWDSAHEGITACRAALAELSMLVALQRVAEPR